MMKPAIAALQEHAGRLSQGGGGVILAVDNNNNERDECQWDVDARMEQKLMTLLLYSCSPMYRRNPLLTLSWTVEQADDSLN